jgi:1-acyl-sn-glycerol-3-phosphate acyltransferase
MSLLGRAARLCVYFAAMLAVCLYCEVIGRVWCMWLAPAGSQTRVRRANRLIRHWHVVLTRLTLDVLGGRLDVRGEVPQGRFVVVSNHQSTADVAMLAATLRDLNLKFVAKQQLGRWIPSVSLALTHWGSALISRHATRDDLRRMKAMARQLEHWDGSVVVFPEGTRSRDGRLLPYKSAALRIIASEANLPLLPVAIDGTHVVCNLVDFALRMPHAHGTLTIGAPIAPEVWRGRLDEVVEEIREWTDATITAGRRGDVARPRAESVLQSAPLPPRVS